MDSAAQSPAVRARRVDRRSGIHALVQGVAADLLTAFTRRNFSAFVVERLTRFGRLRSVRLSEITNTLAPRSTSPIRSRDHLGIVIPVRDSGRSLLLEAFFDAKTGPDDWTCQLLESAASLTAILVES